MNSRDRGPRRLRTALSQKIERLVDRATAHRTEPLRTELVRLHQRISDLQDMANGSLDTIYKEVAQLHDRVRVLQESNTGSQQEINWEIAALGVQLAKLRNVAAAIFDDIPALRRDLLAARDTPEYERALNDPEPLVTVRIPTYVRSKLLVERALPSVVGQTYQNFEVIVVGDGCTNDTAERVDEFGDPRVRFYNLPFRYPYPTDPEHCWLVAGGPGANVGAELANGSWLASLGDDDEFEPHHLECLLEHARSTRSEMVYGNLLVRRPAPACDQVLACHPPELGRYNCNTSIYMRALRCFEFSARSWVIDEPSDWNLCRRMVEAGVRIGHVDRVVTIHYPSHDWEPETFH